MGRMQVAGKEVRSRAAARSIEVNHLGSSSMLRTSQIRVELTSSPSPTATTPNRRQGMIASLTVASQRLPSFHESRSIMSSAFAFTRVGLHSGPGRSTICSKPPGRAQGNCDWLSDLW